MTDRAARRAEQRAKLSAMPLGRRVSLVIAGTVAAIGAAAIINLFLTGGPGLVAAVVIGLAVGLVLAYQYLWSPR
jgi:multisubunit Na+/H+ antiporter MnhB subunit